jgi:hypothetical protein
MIYNFVSVRQPFKVAFFHLSKRRHQRLITVLVVRKAIDTNCASAYNPDR